MGGTLIHNIKYLMRLPLNADKGLEMGVLYWTSNNL